MRPTTIQDRGFPVEFDEPVQSRYAPSFETLMLAETMHRVANDMSVVVGSLMTARRALQPTDHHAIDGAITRVAETADLQRLLCPPLQPGRVDLRERLERVCSLLAKTRLAGGTVGLRVHADQCFLDARACWSVAAVVAELVTNATKHAFPSGVGEIVVRGREIGGWVVVLVMDDGVGRAGAGRTGAMGAGLGRGIIDELVAASGGSLRDVAVQVGTAVEFILPPERG